MTARFLFKMTETYSDKVVTFESNTATLTELLEDFAQFVRGCGFFPPEKSNLDWVPWEEEETPQSDYLAEEDDKDVSPNAKL
jgi:hypothetical protein